MENKYIIFLSLFIFISFVSANIQVLSKNIIYQDRPNSIEVIGGDNISISSMNFTFKNIKIYHVGKKDYVIKFNIYPTKLIKGKVYIYVNNNIIMKEFAVYQSETIKTTQINYFNYIFGILISIFLLVVYFVTRKLKNGK